MRIGIHISNDRKGGGQFRFLVMVLDALFNSNATDEVYLFYSSEENKLSQRYNKEKWHWIELEQELTKPDEWLRVFILAFSNFFKKIIKNLLNYLGITLTAKKGKIDYALNWTLRLKEKVLFRYKLDFIIFPTWTGYCWEWGAPFIFAVHDLQHRLQPEFPEVSLKGQWGWRESFFSKAIHKAEIILVDSEEGKRNVLQFYDCIPEKIKVLPFTIPSTSLVQVDEKKREELINKLNIPQKFFFYPANFWPHKNHYRVIEAAGLVKERYGIEIPIVFSGETYSEWQVLAMCETLAEKYSLKEQVYYVGYVSDEELVALYMTAVGLVMPTYFGPTNIPYLEAFYYKCPVIASDILGIREQVKDAAFLVNPEDTDAIAEAMYVIWTNQHLRETLIKNGQERLKEFLPERFKEKLNAVIDELRNNAI